MLSEVVLTVYEQSAANTGRGAKKPIASIKVKIDDKIFAKPLRRAIIAIFSLALARDCCKEISDNGVTLI